MKKLILVLSLCLVCICGCSEKTEDKSYVPSQIVVRFSLSVFQAGDEYTFTLSRYTQNRIDYYNNEVVPAYNNLSDDLRQGNTLETLSVDDVMDMSSRTIDNMEKINLIDDGDSQIIDDFKGGLDE